MKKHSKSEHLFIMFSKSIIHYFQKITNHIPRKQRLFWQEYSSYGKWNQDKVIEFRYTGNQLYNMKQFYGQYWIHKSVFVHSLNAMAMEPSAGFCYFVDVELPIKKLYVMCAM